MKLRDLFEPTIIEPVTSEVFVTDVVCDSRKVTPGSLFFAVPGTRVDGATFVEQAIQRGAVGIVIETGSKLPTLAKDSYPVIRVQNIRAELARVARRFSGDPDRDLFCAGVTGTNGKTSVAWILAHALADEFRSASYVGTLGNKIVDEAGREVFAEETINTTPDPVSTFKFLADGIKRGTGATVAEVTSHAMSQHRLDGVQWNCGIFTNLTRDHLDYHQTMERYFGAKALLFSAVAASSKKERFVVVNIDDPYGVQLRDRFSGRADLKVLSFSTAGTESDIGLLNWQGDAFSTEISYSAFGAPNKLTTKLVGSYNVENILGTIATLVGCGWSADRIGEVIATVPTVPGRLQRVSGDGLAFFIDYAHTPDALVKAQQALRPLTQGRLITVFGCGGDRDRGKRPMMAKAVSELSDVAILTSDNPRTEDPMAIIRDAAPGLGTVQAYQEVDRRRAIELARSLAKAGDIVLVAGKGHEPYQEIDGVRHPFDDRKVCQEVLGQRG